MKHLNTFLIALLMILNVYILNRIETKNFVQEVEISYKDIEGKEVVSEIVKTIPIPEIPNGSKHNIPRWIWVDVVNAKGRDNTCGIGDGGYLIVIGEYDELNVLCRFVLTGSDGGTACDDGVEFVIDKFTVAGFKKEFEEKELAQKAHKRKLFKARYGN